MIITYYVKIPHTNTRQNISRNIYIIGTESSGTRYVSRGIYDVIKKRNGIWDGERPPCKFVDHHLSIHHVSIPFGSYCDGFINILQHVDLCHKIPSNRFFLNVSNVLMMNKNDKAIIILRDSYFTKRSILKNHCYEKRLLDVEYEMSIQIIKEAIDKFDNTKQLLVVNYETMAIYNEREWRRISDFLGAMYKEPLAFYNGNNL